MRVLLDTNILIHREARTTVRQDIGVLFRWLDRLHHEKCIHPASIAEIERHSDPDVVRTFKIKLDSYAILKTIAPDTSAIATIRPRDATENDKNDTSVLNELAAGRVDILITEDRGIHEKAQELGLASGVFTIDGFLEKVNAENPNLADYAVLAVRKQYFGNVNLADPFFDTFRAEYPTFDAWFSSKADEVAYTCTAEDGRLLAFLFVKKEGVDENYADISPAFTRAVRLKIGTFKVASNGYKLGERFLKIIFDNALQSRVDEIYVTVFSTKPERDRLVKLLEDWGFVRHGQKRSAAGVEEVYVRNFRPRVDTLDPRQTYPYISGATRKFIVPIYPAYHTELLPDSILRTESPSDFVESKPNRNAISKVYISRSIERNLRAGDLIVFYRTASGGHAHHTSVATTIGVVQQMVTGIKDKASFVSACRKRSVFTDKELGEYWDYNPRSRPFVVNFLYISSLPKRPNLAALKEFGIIAEAPRGFELLADIAFDKLLEVSNADQRLIVH